MVTNNAPSPPPDGNQTRGSVVLIAQVVMTSIALILVLLRCFQMRLLKAIKGDDICIIFSMVTTLTASFDSVY